MRRRRVENAGGGTVVPVDDLIDVAHQSISLAVREMSCRIGIDTASFRRASANLERIGQIKLSDELLRQVVESEGRAVIAWADQEQLELDFDARQCVTSETESGAPASRAYVGIDGFMIPMVTQAEADKRLKKARTRRKTLKRKKGVRRRPLRRQARGADQRYKEFKLVTMYDQDQEHKLTRVTRGGVDSAQRLLRGMAEDVHLHGADQVVAVTDGAEWIAGLVDRNLPRDKTTAILDFYHAGEHVHQTRRVVFGEASEPGKAWAEQVIAALLKDEWDRMWQHLASRRARVRGPAKQRSLDHLMQYLAQRREKLRYGQFRAAGLQIGSGPTESGCKSEARRLKGAGMRWTGRNAEAIMALEGLHQSHLCPLTGNDPTPPEVLADPSRCRLPASTRNHRRPRYDPLSGALAMNNHRRRTHLASPARSLDREAAALQRLSGFKSPRSYEKSLGIQAVSVFQQQIEKQHTRFGQLAELWRLHVPEPIWIHSALTSYVRGTLTVTLDSSSHLFELKQILLAGLERQILFAGKKTGLRKISLKLGGR